MKAKKSQIEILNEKTIYKLVFCLVDSRKFSIDLYEYPKNNDFINSLVPKHLKDYLAKCYIEKYHVFDFRMNDSIYFATNTLIETESVLLSDIKISKK
ncbi:hypothetical protein DLH72_00800 [Candidatus Gracilibacteria bacterium]|nr:MAG: hypothetical protein DLH72_00800 [Candidatus Gracilibacteria bacterium]